MTTQTQDIEQQYTLIDRDRVLDFLGIHSYLMPILVGAHERVTAEFPGSRLFLRVATDPDSMEPDNANRLVTSIATDLEPLEAIGRLDRIDDDWWLAILPSTQGKLILDLEFVRASTEL